MVSRISRNTRVWIKDLVIAYSAFNEANNRPFGRERDCGIAVWAELLLAAQDNLSVEMHERQMLVDMLANARTRQSLFSEEVAA